MLLGPDFDLAEPTANLTDLADAEYVSSEAAGMRQRLAFDPQTVTAAELPAEAGKRAYIKDLSIEEPDIEDVVRQLYEASR